MRKILFNIFVVLFSLSFVGCNYETPKGPGTTDPFFKDIFYLTTNDKVYFKINENSTFEANFYISDDSLCIRGLWEFDNCTLTLKHDSSASKFYFTLDDDSNFVYEGQNVANNAIVVEIKIGDVFSKKYKKDINGEYLGKCIYQSPILSSIVLSNYYKINDNKINGYEFVETQLKNNFFESSNMFIIPEDDSNWVKKLQDTKDVYYAEVSCNDNYCNGFYLFVNNDDLYLFNAGYSEKLGYTILRGFMLTSLEDIKTSLSDTFPEDFSFSIRFGFDGYYDSKTHELKNGYNDELNMECKTELILDITELQEIYELLRNVKIDQVPNSIRVSEDLIEPSYTLNITYTINESKKSVSIFGSSYINVDDWYCYQDLGKAFFKVVEEYITSSEEFKALPENTNLYD